MCFVMVIATSLSGLTDLDGAIRVDQIELIHVVDDQGNEDFVWLNVWRGGVIAYSHLWIERMGSVSNNNGTSTLTLKDHGIHLVCGKYRETWSREPTVFQAMREGRRVDGLIKQLTVKRWMLVRTSDRMQVN